MNTTRPASFHWAATALSAATALAAGGAAQAAPVTVMNAAGNTVMGVDGIQFNGSTYDVRFVDGTCVALFDGCNSNTNSFLFTTAVDARAASTALGAALLQSALPGAINGATVTSTDLAGILTPYLTPSTANVVSDGLFFRSTTNTNASLNGPFVLSYSQLAMSRSSDLSSSARYAYASWSAATPTPSANDVPEPGSLALTAVGLGAAFLAAGKTRRRRGV